MLFLLVGPLLLDRLVGELARVRRCLVQDRHLRRLLVVEQDGNPDPQLLEGDAQVIAPLALHGVVLIPLDAGRELGRCVMAAPARRGHAVVAVVAAPRALRLGQQGRLVGGRRGLVVVPRAFALAC